MPLLEAVKVLVSIMMSVSLSNKGKPLKLRHYDISWAHFQGTAQRFVYIKLPTEERPKYGEDKVGRGAAEGGRNRLAQTSAHSFADGCSCSKP